MVAHLISSHFYSQNFKVLSALNSKVIKRYYRVNTDIPRFIALCFLVLHRCCVFYKLKEDPPPVKKILTHFIELLT